jgi:signal peptidase II
MRVLGLVLAVVTFVVDQLTKWWALDSLRDPPVRIEVLPFWDMVLVWNRGVSFGLFGAKPLPPLVLAAVTAAIALGIVIWLLRTRSKWSAVAAGLILGGAIGNIVDRLAYGAVVDFIDWHAYGYHWPVFNVADAGITVGVAVLIAESIFGGKAESKSRNTREK